MRKVILFALLALSCGAEAASVVRHTWPALTVVTKWPDGTTATQTEAPFETVSTSVDQVPAPVVVAPGSRVADDGGAVLYLRDTDGALFRNGQRLGAFAAEKAVSYGGDTFVRGRTDGKWWRWDAPTKKWQLLTGAVELDPTVFP